MRTDEFTKDTKSNKSTGGEGMNNRTAANVTNTGKYGDGYPEQAPRSCAVEGFTSTGSVNQHTRSENRAAGYPEQARRSCAVEGFTSTGSVNQATGSENRTAGKAKGRMSRFLGAFLAVAIGLGTFGAGLMFTGGARDVYADDTRNTVPSDEGYTAVITTNNDGKNADKLDPYVQDAPYDGNATNVRQSTSTSSATTFAAGAPLSTIYIDQGKIQDATLGEFHYGTSVYSSETYLHYYSSNGRVNFRANTSPKKLYAQSTAHPDLVNSLEGDLFYFIFPEAAILPNGEKANLKITYSNAKIVVDKRYAYDDTPYGGEAYLAMGATIEYGGTDTTNMETISDASERVKLVNAYLPNGNSFANGNAKHPILGQTIDVTYQIVDENEAPINGSFIYAITGINLDRDPWRGTASNNYAKPVWYANNQSGGNYYHFFSESLIINEGQKSDYVYVRSNNNTLDDYNTEVGDVNTTHFYPSVISEKGKTRFISNAENTNSAAQGNNDTYSTGFITIANAAAGFKVTLFGHGGPAGDEPGRLASLYMESKTFASKQLWYRYTESTGLHGSIATTSEGNFKGTLDDTSDKGAASEIYKPEGVWNKGSSWNGIGTPSGIGEAATHVVTEGKDVYYTMTPDIGYKISHLWIGKTWDPYTETVTEYNEILYNGEAVSKMKKGDSVTVTTVAGNTGELTYNDDGTYTLKFPHAEHHEAVHVEWEPTTADIYAAKIWDDNNDEDGMRELMYTNDSAPRFKLQYSITGGKTESAWFDVTDNSFAGVTINPARTTPDYAEQDVPSGEEGGIYKDGTYYINNDTTGVHPYTWEYLPVYTYDSNGTADKFITYRIVEVDNDPVNSKYKSVQYFDAKAFELSSEASKSVDGWQMYSDGTDNYVRKGDKDKTGELKYCQVGADGKVESNAANPQPDESSLTVVSSNSYRTTDKAIPYQSVELLNEHTVRKIYVDVTKFWNDNNDEVDNIKSTETNPPGGNHYERRNLKFILHGETEDEDVDLNGDTDGTDKEITLETTEGDPRNKTIDNYKTYKDADGNQYAYVKDDATYPDGYYPVENGAINYAGGPASVSADSLYELCNENYKIDDNNFGVYFSELPTHHGGKEITYTVTEVDAGTGKALDGWVVSGGSLQEKRNSSNEIEGYTANFMNTPRVENVYNKLPLILNKRDATSHHIVLEGAEFTIYKDAVNKIPASDADDVLVGGEKVYTDGTNEYVRKTEDTSSVYYTFSENGSGAYTYTKADPQPAETDLKVKHGEVESNVVTTDAYGRAYINFLEPGTYQIMETKSPTGYKDNTAIYGVIVDQDLKSITLEDPDDDHETSWWKKFFEMLYMQDPQSTIPNFEWNATTSELTIDNEPLSASILVRKYWDDADNQDGYRPADTDADNMPKVTLKWTTSAHTATGLPVYQDASGNKYVHNATEDKYYEVTTEDTAGTYDASPVDPQPAAADLTEVTGETCQGRTVYKDGDDKNYVLVGGKYYSVTSVDTTGTIKIDPANPQPAESDLTLMMEGTWANAQVDDGSGTGTKTDASAPVSFAGGPVLTGQYNAYTWSNIPAYIDGKPVIYSIEETSPLLDDGTYYVKYNHTSDTHEKVFTLINNSSQTAATHNQTVDVTNKHDTHIINIEAYKTWNDDNADKREQTTLTLYKTVDGARSVVTSSASGAAVPDTRTVTTTDTDPADPMVWRDLPAYEYRNPITYTIVETSVDGYITEYNVEYTDENDNSVNKKEDSVEAKTVKRTYYSEDDKTAGKIPDGKDVGDESTTAVFRIENDETVDIEVSKMWVDGAVANVDFQLWRTTKAESDLTTSQIKEIDDPVYWYKDSTGNKITAADYNTLSDGDKANYTALKNTTWSPYASDGTTTVDGWELVTDATHQFLAADFEEKSEAEGGSKLTYTFKDLPTKDSNKTDYIYRVLETTDGTDRFRSEEHTLNSSHNVASRMPSSA